MPATRATLFQSEDYFDARARFRVLAERVGAPRHAHALAARGPRGEILSIDTASLGAAQPKRVVILTSGIHGVEGFAGSALQQLWLAEFAATLPADTAMLLVHAINPFGFAHLRRVNENNVDLNRNALVAYPDADNPDYARLNGWLNPPQPADAGEGFWLPGVRWLLTLGPARLRQAVAAGQYAYPQGLFYGGRQPQESLSIVEAILRQPRWQSAKTVWHLDVHTGLGAWRTYQLLSSEPPTSFRYRVLAEGFGHEHVKSNAPENFTHYAARGILPELTVRAFPSAQVFAATLEFGTYSPTRLLRALRAENRLRHHGARDPRVAARIRAETREVFYPADPAWRATLIDSGTEVFTRLHAALTSG